MILTITVRWAAVDDGGTLNSRRDITDEFYSSCLYDKAQTGLIAIVEILLFQKLHNNRDMAKMLTSGKYLP